MWNHPAFCLLRADHLHALSLAFVARHATENAVPGAAEWAWAEAREELERGELGVRLRVVEEVLLPVLEEVGLEELPCRVREAHRNLFALLRPVAPGELRTHLRALAFHLAACVRVDEEELLMHAERLLGEPVLTALLDACLAMDATAVLAPAPDGAPHPLRAAADDGRLCAGQAPGRRTLH